MSSLAGNVITFEVTKYDSTSNSFIANKKLISVERYFELRLNGEFCRKIFCSPNDVEDLTIGILAQTEKIFSVEDITHLEIKKFVNRC